MNGSATTPLNRQTVVGETARQQRRQELNLQQSLQQNPQNKQNKKACSNTSLFYVY